MNEDLDLHTKLEMYLDDIEEPLFYQVDMSNCVPVFFSYN